MTAIFGVSQFARVEDPRLLTGLGNYLDDAVWPDQLHAVLVRSPHAHALIRAIDVTQAKDAEGVVAIYTAFDLEQAGIQPVRCDVPLINQDGSARANPTRYPLARDRVRHVGDPVALVVAVSAAQARDAAEQVVVDYAPLPATIVPRTALVAGAPAVWDDVAANTCFDWAIGNAADVARCFANAHHVVSIELENNRVVANPLEPRGANARYDAARGRWTINIASQGVFALRRALAASLDVPIDRLQVITGDVGGGFGIKLYMYVEYVLVAFAARALGRPVKWVADRSESFLADVHGRSHVSTASIALDAAGRFTALRVDTIAELGAYLSTYAPLIPTIVANQVLPSIYQWDAVHARVRGVFTHTTPIDAYRGAGKPEAHYLIERLIDVAAGELRLDRAELRRRNLVRPAAMPWRNAVGVTYDSGDFPAVLERAVRAADWDSFAERRALSARAGRRRGIGLACYIEATGGQPAERAEIKFTADGYAEVLVGTQSTEQGHETAYTQLVAARLGIAPEKIRIVQGDSDRVIGGGGTGGSRSLYAQGTALAATIERTITLGLEHAASALECACVDIEFLHGSYRVKGTDRAFDVLAVAQYARAHGASLDAAADTVVSAHTFPHGCHVAEVEIDPATGVITVLRYSVVDDMGTVLNPTIVIGQITGGVAQGLGQALLEHARFDATGQLLTGSFLDYAMPRADDLPALDVILAGVPCTTNPLGVKGAGEAGAIGSAPAVVNAVMDALAADGVRHLDMPLSAERVWRAIRREPAA